MEVAYTSELVGDDWVLRELHGDGEPFGLTRGLIMPRAETYCQRMLDGRIANLTPDVLADDRTASLPITRSAGLRAFATVPLTFSDGRLYGTLCATSRETMSFDYRDLQCLLVLARLVADQLEREETATAANHVAALVDAADDAILTLTPGGLVTSWNAASERAFGYPASNAIGRGIVALIAVPGHEDELLRAMAAAAAGEVFHRNGRRRRADDTIVCDALTMSPIRDRHGDVTSIAAVSRDITDAVRQAHYGMVERHVVSALSRASDAAEAAAEMLRGVGQGLDCQIGALWELAGRGHRLHCSALWTTAVAIPLRLAGEIVGVVEFLSGNLTPENAAMLAMGEAIVARLADALARLRAQEALREANLELELRVRERTAELERAVAELDGAQIETVRRLSSAVEFRDQDTGAHIGRISGFAARIARRAGLDAGRCDLIERASPLHDVGKVAIPDSVLLKPGALTPAERAVIETHAEIGHRLLGGSDSPVLQTAAIIARTHHERYDGSGYPHRLAGERIPVEGRIVAIADVFDALTSDRVYRPAMTVDQAVAILRDGRGTHFDPVLLDHFLGDLAAAGDA